MQTHSCMHLRRSWTELQAFPDPPAPQRPVSPSPVTGVADRPRSVRGLVVCFQSGSRASAFTLFTCARAREHPQATNAVSSLAVKIKKPIKTKFRMPVFNWVALKPNQINGTVFNEIDDERILEVGLRFSAGRILPGRG